MELFTPSLDWNNEVVASLLWVAKAWIVSAVVTLAVLFLIARFTTWGSQFWRVTGNYFKGRQSIPVWGLLAVVGFGWWWMRHSPAPRHCAARCRGTGAAGAGAHRLPLPEILSCDPRSPAPDPDDLHGSRPIA